MDDLFQSGKTLQGPLPTPAEIIYSAEVPQLANAEIPRTPFKGNITSLDLNTAFSVGRYDSSLLPDTDSAKAVVELFHKTYGQGNYPSKEFASSDNYVGEVATGRMYSLVARNAEGKIVGHAAVVPVGDNSAELGRLFVDPEARVNNLGRTLVDMQIKCAEQLHDEGKVFYVFADAVTNHRASQKLYSRYMGITGIYDRKYTDFFGVNNRESMARFARILSPEVSKNRNVYIPSTYHEASSVIYSELQCERTVSNSSVNGFSGGKTELFKDSSELKGYEVMVLVPGNDRHILQILKDADDSFKEGAMHVSIKVDITSPHAIGQINGLKAGGFYFAGIETMPSAEYLVMQKLHSSEVDIYFPFIEGIYPKAANDLLTNIISSKYLS